ncbi:MAG: threonine ammonia-lyase [Deltaproteobacteria bacterium]|nr:threonine ammonia-lyase [Deltaproteobacteria bacterium]
MFDLIKEASVKLKNIINPTPLIFSSSFSKIFGFECYLKLENMQKTGSFKIRGAYNKISSLPKEEKDKGVITASSGNHAQGVAWASSLLGVKSLIVMPETTPIIKYIATKGYGGEVLFYGKDFFESYTYAKALAKERGLAFIPPFEDDLIIAGQGTIGLEILDALPDVDTIVVPVGGGGLISGIALAAKEINPDITMIGVEAKASNSCVMSIRAGRPVQVEKQPTIADGIAVKKVGDKTFSIIKRNVDAVFDVEEDSIASAILQLLERKKLIVEGAGAVSVAAAFEGKLPKVSQKVVFVLSGGNIDVTMLDRVIRLGLLKEGRILKLTTIIPDVPGSLAKLTSEIAALKANILHVIHQREAVDIPVSSIGLEVILEVESFEHADRVFQALGEKGYVVKR